MKYLLDLDTLSALSEIDSSFHKKALSKVHGLSKNDTIFLSVLTIYELNYSLSNAGDEQQKKQIENTISRCKKHFDILPLTVSGADIYGELKAGFKRKTGINKKAIKRHNIDMMIASTALDYQCVLVARDHIYKDHLVSIIPQLTVEDWTE